MEAFPQETYALINNSANLSKLISIDNENVTAGRTSNLRITFKPSDLSEGLVATVRALQRNAKLSE
jgi:hypothetical protein